MTPTTQEASLRPPLKWAGGKRWQVPHIQTLWKPHSKKRLVEPFCGGLAIALGLSPGRALLNDANAHLIHFYQWLQRGLRIELRMENDEQLFYAHRERFNELLRTGRAESAEAASIFYFLNRTGFNGLCRFNQQGEFNVPFGRYVRIGYERDFLAYVDALRGWVFTNIDFEAVPIERGDFVYADPPYDVEFTQYSKGGFSWSDQERTAFADQHVHAGLLVSPPIWLARGKHRRLPTLDGADRQRAIGDVRVDIEILAVHSNYR